MNTYADNFEKLSWEEQDYINDLSDEAYIWHEIRMVIGDGWVVIKLASLAEMPDTKTWQLQGIKIKLVDRLGLKSYIFLTWNPEHVVKRFER